LTQQQFEALLARIQPTQSMALEAPARFECDGEDRATNGQRWTKWLSGFETYIQASGVTDDHRILHTLLHTVGPRVKEIYDNLGGAGTYGEAKQKLKNHFNPQKNLDYERLVFSGAYHRDHESTDEYVVRLRGLAEVCEFTDKEMEIRRQLMIGHRSDKLREYALVQNASLDQILNMARSKETTSQQLKELDKIRNRGQVSERSEVLQVREKSWRNRNSKGLGTHKPKELTCNKCGFEYPHPKERRRALSVERWGTSGRCVGTHQRRSQVTDGRKGRVAI
jgi:hypothetical protein